MPSTFTLEKVEAGKEFSITNFNSDLDKIQVAIRALQDATSGSGTVSNITKNDTALAQVFTLAITNPTTTPLLTFNAVNKAANLVFASPKTGSAAAPTFRSLVLADLPTITPLKGGNGLTALGTAYQFTRVNAAGTANEWTSLLNGSTKLSITPNAGNISFDVVPANITINSLDASTPLTIANGGTGYGSQQAAINALTAIAGATNEYVLTKDTATGNALWKVQAVGITNINGQSGASVTLGADDIADGATNKYLTNDNLLANTEYAATKSAVNLNTAKVTNATHTGEVVGSTSLTIVPNAVTYAKIQQIGANQILSNPTGSTANVQGSEICPNLLFVGTTLTARQSIFSTKTTTYQMTNTDGIIYADAALGEFPVKFPDTTTLVGGEIFTVQRINGGENAVTVSTFTGGATEAIVGATSGTSISLSGKGHTCCVQYVGTVSVVKTFRIIDQITEWQRI
jgi:hypothetical protein